MSTRFRRLTDLFVVGREVTMPDGTYLWVQAINAYERDECISDAQVARARLVMALREDGTERIKIEARLAERGRDHLIRDLAQVKADTKYPEIVAGVEDDPEWAERLKILRRTDPAESATPLAPEEAQLVAILNAEWYAEVTKRAEAEREWQIQHYTRASDDELLADYLEVWLERKGADRSNAEYRLTEIWYATRYCDAVLDADGRPEHARCGGHPSRVFDTKTDARAIPDGLKELLATAINELGMSARDPKDSANATNSSDSSPTPNEPEESTPSTSIETHELPPGTSPEPSTTP